MFHSDLLVCCVMSGTSLCTVVNLSDLEIFLVTEWRRRWNTNGTSSRRSRGSREERSGLKQHAHSLLITFQWTELWVCFRQIHVKPFKKSYPIPESYTYSPRVWKSSDYLKIYLVWWWSVHFVYFLPSCLSTLHSVFLQCFNWFVFFVFESIK